MDAGISWDIWDGGLLKEGLRESLFLWRKVLPVLAAGLLAGRFFAQTRVFELLAGVFGTIACRMQTPSAAAALSMVLLSPYAGLAFAAERAREEKWDLHQVVVFGLMASFPRGLHFLLFSLAAPAVAGLGPTGAGLYLACYGVVSFLPSLGGYLCARDHQKNMRSVSATARYTPESGAAITGWRNTAILFARTAIVFCAATLAVNCLLLLPRARGLLVFFSNLAALLRLPGEATLVLAAALVSTVGALAVAAPLVQAKTLTAGEAILALYLGALGHYVLEFWRHGLPTYVALFGIGAGTRVAAAVYLALVAATLAVVSALGLWVWRG